MTQSESKPSLGKKIARKSLSLLITIGFFGIAGVAVWQGSSLIAQRADAVVPPKPTATISVETASIALRDHYRIDRSFTGQVEAPQTVDIAFETPGTLRTVFVDEGDRVTMGQVLAEFDDRLLKADLKRLQASKRTFEAQRELATLTNQRQAELKKKGFASHQSADQSRLSVVEAEARIAEIDAAILAAQIRLEKAQVVSPFDGRVNRRNVDPGTVIGSGQAVLTLVEDTAAVFRVGVEPDLADTLPVGKSIQVDLDDQLVTGQIIAVLPEIDPVTRTRIVRAALKAPADLAFGQTGQLRITQRIDESGAWIPLSAIENGVRGLWTIKTVDGGGKNSDGGENSNGGAQANVVIEAVEILHADEERAFVRGTFGPDTRLILSGLHRVAPGQLVRVSK